MERFRDIKNLSGRAEGVPYPTPPLYWDRRLPVVANLNAIESYMNKYRLYIPEGCAFDEAAIMVPNATVRTYLHSDLAQNGWERFNRAADLVHTNPFGTRYVVEYVFFRHPDKPYRIEVMLLGGLTEDGQTGFSPLHQALWHPDGIRPLWGEHSELPVPHLSFKPPAETVAAVGARKAVRQVLDYMLHRERSSFLMAQACQSSYGEFWYLLHQDANRQVYLKPRINTRDEK